MNVASLECSKQLYELSKWGYYPLERDDELTHFQWRRFEGKTTGSVYFSYAENYDQARRDPFDRRHPTGTTHRIDVVCAAYDLAYLVQKLPRTLQNPNHVTDKGLDATCVLFVSVDVDEHNRFVAGYDSVYGSRVIYFADADTPEDAVAMLAIELFNQGILTA